VEVGRKILKGSFYRTSSHVLTMLMAFMLLPVIVQNLGDENYGIWVIVAALGGYYGALDFGMSSAVVRFVSKNIENKVLVTKYMCTSFYMLLAISIFTVIVAILISSNLSTFGMIRYDNTLIQSVVLICGLSTAVGFLSKTSVGLITSLLRYDIISLIQLCSAIIRTFLTYQAMTSGAGLFELAIILLLCSVIESVGLIFSAYLKRGNEYLRIDHFDFHLLKEMINYSKYTFVAQVSDILRNYSFPIMIAGSLDLKSVAPFAIAMRVWSMIGSICSSMISIFTPIFSKYDSDKKQAEIVYLRALRFSNYIGLYVCIIIIILMQPLLNLWLGNEIANNVYPICLILGISTMSSVSQMPTVNLLYGFSRNKQYAVSNLAQGVISLSLAYLVSKNFGVTGVAWSIAATGVIIKLYVQSGYAVKALELPMSSYYQNFFRLISVPIFYGVCIYFLSLLVNMSNIYSLILFAVGVSCLYFSVVYIFHVPQQERILLNRIVMARSI
jgi:O-antigen/teichoic acid export membrane protein